MDKSIYEKASAELILFDNSDVVVTSPENGGSVGCDINVFSAGDDDVRCDFGW